MKRWIAAATIVLVFSPVVWAQPVYFADPDLKAEVEAELGVTNPTAGDMALMISFDGLSSNIDDLTGLEYAVNLERLYLRINQISDLSPLAGLTNLRVLHVSHNQISDVSPLAGLTNLGILYLGGNQISDLSPLAALTNLAVLYLEDTQISDLSPLAGWTHLEALRLDMNQIVDLSALAGLTKLEYLFLAHNQIRDLSPLAGLTNLEELDLRDNQISDISPLAGLTNLEDLYLFANPLCQEACDVYIPLLESYGTFVLHSPCIECRTVPNVVGLSRGEAVATLTAAGFRVGNVGVRMPCDAPVGTVVEQNPAADGQAASGSAVDLIFSEDSTARFASGVSLPGAIAYWRLDETGGRVAHDQTGSHDGMAFGNPIWQPTGGQLGGSLLFDGVDDYVDCGTFDPSAATGQLTVCLWARWNGLNGWYQGLIGKRDFFSDQTMMWQIEASMQAGDLTFKQAGDPAIAAPALPVGEWAHVAATFDGATARLYLGGNETSSGQFSLGSGSEAQLVFGACEKNGINSFNGALDDVRLYDQVLNESQIKAVMVGLTDLVGHWKLDETTGATAFDSSGRSHHGTLRGNPIWLPEAGRIAGALMFDGVNDYIDCGDDAVFDLTEQMTVAAWIKVGLFDKGWQAIVTKGDNAWRMQRSGYDNGIEFACTGLSVTGTPHGHVLGWVNVNDGQWHHLAGVYDGSGLYLYVDGVLDVVAPASGSIATNAFDVCIGENAQARGCYWNGLIDDVRLYDQALSEAEIQHIYESAP